MQKQYYYYIGGAVLILVIALVWIFSGEDLEDKIVFPYIAHQKPVLDPHLPHSVPLSDKLDEVLYDGLFNVSANASGVTYEDGLGEFMGIDRNNYVSVRLKPNKKWHSSYQVQLDDDEVMIATKPAVNVAAKDIAFTLRRIQKLGPLSPDYILVSQALRDMTFQGPDENDEIRFHFKSDREWKEDEIKEVLSFKVLPATSEMNAAEYTVGSGPYLSVKDPESGVSNFYENPATPTEITQILLRPYIDNSTFTTEIKNENINVLLETPFGSLSPLLEEKEDFFVKSNISNTFFALLFNTQKLNREQRQALRDLIDSKVILDRFYKTGSEQQRNIVDYKGNSNNYGDYLNYSIFPSSTYYVEEKIVRPRRQRETPNLSVLPDTVKIQACLNYGHREEYTELVEILNDPAIFKNRLKATAVENAELKKGNYHALLIAIDGYRSTFLFDLYDIFFREPDLALYRINLQTKNDASVDPATWNGSNNFLRLSAGPGDEQEDILRMLEYMHEFMATRELGDKQAYAEFIDNLEQDMALGKWMFSIPSLAYFTRQFDEKTIDLYGKASQLSTIEKWKETVEE